MAKPEPVKPLDAGMRVHGPCPVEANGKNILEDGTKRASVGDEILRVERAVAETVARQQTGFVFDVAAPMMMIDDHQRVVQYRHAEAGGTKQEIRILRGHEGRAGPEPFVE